MSCSHPNTETVVLHQGPHHAKITCSDCGAFIRWLPKPETLERIKANAAKIDGLSGRGLPLTQWERHFVGSIQLHPTKLSPKQQETLDRIASHYGV